MTLVKELDRALAYVYCPTCRLSGNPNVTLTRNMHEIRCNFGHTFTGDQLVAMGADMVPMANIQPEQPTITDIKWSIWINPKVKQKIEQKFANRAIITIATFLAALADDSLVMITAEQATKLRKEYSVRSGAEIIALLESHKQLGQERDDAVKELDKFHKILQSVNAPITG